MEKNYYITLFLDTRRAKKSGKYPVKLRVFCSNPRKQVLYPTKFEFTKEEFKSIWDTSKPRNKHKEIRWELEAIERKAIEAAEKLRRFSFDAFERKMFSLETGKEDLVSAYQEIIKRFKKNGRLSTASTYELSLSSVLEFHNKPRIAFHEVTPQWLKGYEGYMVNEKSRSRTTISIYLRALRAVFNAAIEEEIVSKEFYPFGKRKYTIPAPKGVKKALSKDQLSLLFNATPANPEQEKAKDFWFFSYACNGMNFEDIVKLKYNNLSGDILKFQRQKTVSTNKSQAPVIVFLNDFAKSVIEKYGNKNKAPENLIFSIIESTSDVKETLRRKQNFIRYVNQHIQNLAVSAGIEEKVSTNWARHSYATNAIREGATMEFVSEALSHASMKTTKNYFAGFENEKKREIASKLMDFLHTEKAIRKPKRKSKVKKQET